MPEYLIRALENARAALAKENPSEEDLRLVREILEFVLREVKSGSYQLIN